MLFFFSSELAAQTALSVDFNSLWRVDLSSHRARLVSSFGDPAPFLSCRALTELPDQRLFCVRSDGLFRVTADALEFVSLLPGDSSEAGLASDDLGRLWFVTRNDLMLWRLDPETGAVLETLPLDSSDSTYYALAARGSWLFAFSKGPHPASMMLEEVDLKTGASLSTRDVGLLGIDFPLDAAFDDSGALWVANARGEIILGLNCYSFDRVELSPLTATREWNGCIHVYEDPVFANIAAVQAAPIVDIPTVTSVGVFVLGAGLLISGVGVLRSRQG